jgi:hypothetical protein
METFLKEDNDEEILVHKLYDWRRYDWGSPRRCMQQITTLGLIW